MAVGTSYLQAKRTSIEEMNIEQGLTIFDFGGKTAE